MMNKRKAISLFLTLALVCALLPTVALAVTVTEVVPCKYEDANSFSEGLAAVRLNGKYGYIDKTGEVVIPCKYDWAEDFSEGLAKVKLNYKIGFIDKTGNEAIPCKYDGAGPFVEGLARVRMDDFGTGKYKYGFIDKMGNEVVPCKYNNAADFSDGLARVKLNSKIGFIDKTGNEVIPCKYSWAGPFVDGLARVKLNSTVGFIDKMGNEVIPCKYDDIADFSEGLAAVQLKDKGWGFIDQTGNEVISCKYNAVHDFSEGLAAVALTTGEKKTYGFIDKTGKEVVPFGKYDGVHDFSEGLAAVRVGQYGLTRKYGFIDTTGKEVVPCTLGYSYVKDFSEGLVAVQRDDKYGFLAIDGYTEPTQSVPATKTAYASTQTVNVDGKAVTFECYALKEGNGMTNYIKLRDLAVLLNGSAAQFQVGWDGSVTITTKTAYTPNGSELKTPYSGDRAYQEATAATKVNGQAARLAAFVLNDDNGGGYTYYQLRDLGKALGFNVGWAADKGIFVETNKPYDPAN